MGVFFNDDKDEFTKLIKEKGHVPLFSACDDDTTITLPRSMQKKLLASINDFITQLVEYEILDPDIIRGDKEIELSGEICELIKKNRWHT